MSKTASKKEVLKRLNRIKKNRFFTRMMLYVGASAATLISPVRQDATAKSYNAGFGAENIRNVSFNAVNKEEEISKRADWFFDNALDSLRRQYEEFTSLKKRQQNKMIQEKFFGGLNIKGGNTFYCLAATMSNYARNSRLSPDLTDILPDLSTDDSYTKAHCKGFVDFMLRKSKKEYDNKFVIKSSNLNKEIDKVGKGAIFIIESKKNNSSGYHAITYLGKDEKGVAQFMSYNREKITPLSYWNKGAPVKGYAVDLYGMYKASWEKKTQNCNKMEFLALMYQNRENPLEPKLELLKPQEHILPVSSVFVKKAVAVAPLKVAKADVPVWTTVSKKRKSGPVFFIAKNKIALKRKFQLASRWTRNKAQERKNAELEKLAAFFDRPKKGSTYNAAPLFANYNYKII
ncbi:MAG: hypothetical protein SO314_01680 [Alphaproteobacteria bacterium]|nr:hypothetical protein [Alphaproteobacteria bacterium]